MGKEWLWTLERSIGGKKVVVVAAGRDAREALSTWDGRSIGDETWNLVTASVLEELLGPGHVGYEVNVAVYVGDVEKRLVCQTPASVDVAGVARCKGGEVLLLIEVKRWSSWKSIVIQARHPGARHKRQESVSGIEVLANCLDVDLPHLKYYGINAYLLALIEDRRLRGVRDPQGYVAGLTGYPRRRVYIVTGARGPSQAKGKIRKALQDILDNASCKPI